MNCDTTINDELTLLNAKNKLNQLFDKYNKDHQLKSTDRETNIKNLKRKLNFINKNI